MKSLKAKTHFAALLLLAWISGAIFGQSDEALAGTRFNSEAVSGIPTAGPNCYFTTLAVNSLLQVPAMGMSSDTAAILFLNPALCKEVASPEPGDVALVEHVPAFARSDLYHVFTYLGQDRGFEKASSYESSPFTFVRNFSLPPNRFVRCQSMQGWVEQALATLSKELVQLNQAVVELESLIDSRVSSRSPNTFAVLQSKFNTLLTKFRNPKELVQESLTRKLRERGHASFPKTSILDNQYYEFVRKHPKIVIDPSLFALMWISSRLENVSYIVENYEYMKAARLLP